MSGRRKQRIDYNYSRDMREEFAEFCEKHPELRFWQALRAFINVDKIVTIKDGKEEDTYYLELIKKL